jgi:hypothetical protein
MIAQVSCCIYLMGEAGRMVMSHDIEALSD